MVEMVGMAMVMVIGMLHDFDWDLRPGLQIDLRFIPLHPHE